MARTICHHDAVILAFIKSPMNEFIALTLEAECWRLHSFLLEGIIFNF